MKWFAVLLFVVCCITYIDLTYAITWWGRSKSTANNGKEQQTDIRFVKEAISGFKFPKRLSYSSRQPQTSDSTAHSITNSSRGPEVDLVLVGVGCRKDRILRVVPVRSYTVGLYCEQRGGGEAEREVVYGEGREGGKRNEKTKNVEPLTTAARELHSPSIASGEDSTENNRESWLLATFQSSYLMKAIRFRILRNVAISTFTSPIAIGLKGHGAAQEDVTKFIQAFSSSCSPSAATGSSINSSSTSGTWTSQTDIMVVMDRTAKHIEIHCRRAGHHPLSTSRSSRWLSWLTSWWKRAEKYNILRTNSVYIKSNTVGVALQHLLLGLESPVTSLRESVLTGWDKLRPSQPMMTAASGGGVHQMSVGSESDSIMSAVDNKRNAEQETEDSQHIVNTSNNNNKSSDSSMPEMSFVADGKSRSKSEREDESSRYADSTDTTTSHSPQTADLSEIDESASSNSSSATLPPPPDMGMMNDVSSGSQLNMDEEIEQEVSADGSEGIDDCQTPTEPTEKGKTLCGWQAEDGKSQIVREEDQESPDTLLEGHQSYNDDGITSDDDYSVNTDKEITQTTGYTNVPISPHTESIEESTTRPPTNSRTKIDKESPVTVQPVPSSDSDVNAGCDKSETGSPKGWSGWFDRGNSHVTGDEENNNNKRRKQVEDVAEALQAEAKIPEPPQTEPSRLHHQQDQQKHHQSSFPPPRFRLWDLTMKQLSLLIGLGIIVLATIATALRTRYIKGLMNRPCAIVSTNHSH
eukprot:GHVQ01022155.1.p1 GENE.GHVQ01022155.1~~GHVQ01022155.1.p1  ORF type:complete len:750 (-),score=164.25 GHVQ01022155.1:4359-6608(-)